MDTGSLPPPRRFAAEDQVSKHLPNPASCWALGYTTTKPNRSANDANSLPE